MFAKLIAGAARGAHPSSGPIGECHTDGGAPVWADCWFYGWIPTGGDCFIGKSPR